MKKTCLLMVVLGLLFSARLVGSAYELTELNLTVDIPENWVVFTRDIRADDPKAAELGMDADALRNYMVSANIYLDAMNAAATHEVVVTMVEYDGSAAVHNFNEVSEQELEEAVEYLKANGEAEASGLTYHAHFFYKNNGISYIVLDFVHGSAGATTYGRQYYTIYNGQAINITMHSYLGELSEEMSAMQKQIVDSAHFTKKIANPNPRGVGIDWPRTLKTVAIGAIVVVVSAGGAGIILFLRGKRKKQAVQTQCETPEQAETPAQDEHPSGGPPRSRTRRSENKNALFLLRWLENDCDEQRGQEGGGDTACGACDAAGQGTE